MEESCGGGVEAVRTDQVGYVSGGLAGVLSDGV